MTAGSDLVFDHLSHNYIEPRAEYQESLKLLVWTFVFVSFVYVFLTTHSTHFIYGYMASDKW